MREWWKCLTCGYEWYSHIDASGETLQCPNPSCRSYYTLRKREYEQIIKEVTPLISPTTPILDTIDVLIKIFKALGIRARKPLETAKRIISECERRKSEAKKLLRK